MKATTTLASMRTPDGELLALHRHDGEYFMKIGATQLMSTVASFSEQQMAEVACAKLGAKPRLRVLIGGLGFGFTLRRVLELVPDDATVVVAELLPEVVEWNREHLQKVNGGLMEDPRVEIRLGDVFELIRDCGSDGYDAILLDVDNSPAPLVQKGNARLYARRGMKLTRNALNAGGRVVYWSAHRDKGFHRGLEMEYGQVSSLGAKAYAMAKRFSHTLFVADRD
ncbi:MAG: spermine synthase [Verrucomicrobiota bacterium]